MDPGVVTEGRTMRGMGIPCITGQIMDDKGATLCDFIARTNPVHPEPTSTSSLYLILVNGGTPGAMLRLTPEGTRLGRAPDNEFPLQDPSVSRHHALLELDAQDVVRLTDLGSTNGTYLNGRRV